MSISPRLCQNTALRKPRRGATRHRNWARCVSLSVLLLVVSFESVVAGRSRVRVESMTPAGEVASAANLTWTFSKPVVSDALIRKPLDSKPVTFTPEIPGMFRWVAHDKLRFFPDVKLAPSTEYTAQVRASAVDPHGMRLDGNHEFAFATRRLAVSSAFLTFEFDRGAREQVKLIGTIEFNHDVDPQEFRKHASLLLAGSMRLSFVMSRERPTSILRIEANAIPRSVDTSQIELRIESGLRPVGGNLGLAADYVRPIVLPGADALSLKRVSGVHETARSRYVGMRFSLPVRAEDAREYISVEPPLEFELKSVHDQVQLRGDFLIGQSYRVMVRSGLRAVDGSRLAEDASQSVTFHAQPIQPQVDFVGSGFYLPRDGHLNLGLSTVNVRGITLEIDKVYANNLVAALNAHNFASPRGWSRYWALPLDALGRRVHEAELQIPPRRDQEVVTPIPIETQLGDVRQGIFRVTARETERRWMSATRWVVATDLGIVAKQAGVDLWVWVNSLTTLEHVEGVEVQVFSRNNQALAAGRTNADGVAVLANGSRLIDEFEPYVITATAGDDLSFLELTRRQLSTSDFDVGGLPYLAQGYEAYVYMERDIYRPGETAHVATVVRGPRTSVPEPFPVILKVTGPDGSVLAEQRNHLNEQGGAAFTIPLPVETLTGHYTAALMLGETREIGRTTFSVEEFVPDRMKVRLDLDRSAYRTGDTLQVDVTGTMLFGPPAAGRVLRSNIRIEAAPFAPAGYRSFTFGDPNREFASVQADLPDVDLDDAGAARLTYALPAELQPPAALQATIRATLLDTGGRGVTAAEETIVHAYESYVGARASHDGYAEPGHAYAIDFIVLDAAGQVLSGRSLEVSLYRQAWHTIWRRQNNGRYRYTSESYEVLEDTTSVNSVEAIGHFEVTPARYGRYRLVVEDPRTHAHAVLSFYASGWGDAPWSLESPDRVQLALDRDRYQPGEIANVLVQAPFAGKLLLTVERERILEQRVVTLDGNTATIELPITEEMKPNVYVSAHLIRSTRGLERDDASRAFGVAVLHVDASANRLDVRLEAPNSMRPRTPLTLDIQVARDQVASNAGPAWVTISAVDEGITQLTGFEAPDPHDFFFGKRRLEVKTWDVYGVILPEVASTLYSMAGDVETARRQRVGPVAAKRVKPVSLWSGLVETDDAGHARVAFDVPEFAGTLRVMAVAYAGDRVGNAETRVLVRDPIVMSPTFPRFAATGDHFVVPVSLVNATGVDANFHVGMRTEGPVQLDNETVQRIHIAPDGEAVVYFSIQVDGSIGKATLLVHAEGGGHAVETQVELPVRAPIPYTSITGSGSARPENPATFTFPDSLQPGTAHFKLTASALPTLRFSGSLQYLLRYPHGCLEQTTSRVFPLLAFHDVARALEPELLAENDADYFIEEGIAKLERMQTPSGDFRYWPGGTHRNFWASVYASHFLVEARQAGYVVSDRVYNAMLDALASIARGNLGGDRAELEQATYAVYVLALAGEPQRSAQLYLKNNALDRLPLLSRYQLAGAFAHSGARATAREMLPQGARPPTEHAARQTGGNFNSDARSIAIALDMLATIEPDSPQVPALVEELAQSAENGRWNTTQENAYAFLALGKVLRTQATSDFDATLYVGDEPVAVFGPEGTRIDSQEWASADVRLAVEGTGTCYYYWQAVGLPTSGHVQEYDSDLVVRREYLDAAGNPVGQDAGFEQGDLVIAEVTLKALHERLENVAVVDLLPAGFEIENPRLQSRAGIHWIGKDAYRPDQVDVRDDRIVLYGDLEPGKVESFYYAVRAVTSGSFHLPPVHAEAMYAPAKASLASSGRIVVLDPGGAAPVPSPTPGGEHETGH